MPLIAAGIARVLRGRADADEVQIVRKEVAELCARFPAYADTDVLTPPDTRAHIPGAGRV